MPLDVTAERFMAFGLDAAFAFELAALAADFAVAFELAAYALAADFALAFELASLALAFGWLLAFEDATFEEAALGVGLAFVLACSRAMSARSTMPTSGAFGASEASGAGGVLPASPFSWESDTPRSKS